MKLRELAPAKVNLCLFLGPLRPDGRHELVTVFESVSLADELELEVGATAADEVHAPGVEGPNIVSRALEGLRIRGWEAPPVRVEIHKRIPVAGGMGGGSADAAALLRVAPQLAPIAPDALGDLAAELGSDVPSQLSPGLSLGTGAGDLIDPRPPLAPHAFVILPQPVPLSTAAVYREADRLALAHDLHAARTGLDAALAPDVRLPDHLLINDLAPAAASLCPPVADAIEAVRAAGADQALVCGSGPTVAGLFWGDDATHRAQAAAQHLPEATPAVPVHRPRPAQF